MNGHIPAGGDWLVCYRKKRPGRTVVLFAHLDLDDELTWLVDPNDATAFLTRADALALTRRVRAATGVRGTTLIRRFAEAQGLRRLTDAANESAIHWPPVPAL